MSRAMSMRPKSICSIIWSALPVTSWYRTRGCSPWKLWMRMGKNLAAADSPLPMATTPLSSCTVPVSSRWMRSSSWSISSARRRRSMPSWVSSIFRPPRWNRVQPSSSSSWAICRLRVGWVMCRSSAARVMFPSRATAKK